MIQERDKIQGMRWRHERKGTRTQNISNTHLLIDIMLAAIVRRNRSALAVSSAGLASAAAAAVALRQSKDEHDEDPLTNMNCPRWTNCSCEALKMTALNRQQTMIWLDNTSSKATLESRYKVNWKNPLGEGAFGCK